MVYLQKMLVKQHKYTEALLCDLKCCLHINKTWGKKLYNLSKVSFTCLCFYNQTFWIGNMPDDRFDWREIIKLKVLCGFRNVLLLNLISNLR